MSEAALRLWVQYTHERAERWRTRCTAARKEVARLTQLLEENGIKP